MAITSTMDGAALSSEDANSANDQPDYSQFKVHVKRKTLFWMLLKYGFLSIITLGIYRFWAKTKIRCYLWSSVEFSGDRFEYHGTAKELFIGFLIAFVVLVPLSTVNNAITNMLVVDGSEALLGVYTAAFSLTMLVLFQFAIYRMRRYQLTRTSWRSIRFNLTGSSFRFARISTQWLFVVLFTGGLAYPAYLAWQNRTMINNAQIGNASFRSNISGSLLFKRFIGLYALIVGSVILVALTQNMGLVSSFISFFCIVSTLIAFILFRLSVVKTTVNSMMVSSSNISVSFSNRPIIISWLLSILSSLIIYTVIFSAALGLFLSANYQLNLEQLTDGISQEDLVSLAVGLGYFIPALILAALLARTVYLTLLPVTLMRTIIPGLKIESPEELKEIVQNSGEVPTHGEGFADALDVGAF